MPADNTRTALLDAAQDLAQTRGYNAFSFRDLSKRVRVKTASIHYWFPTKGDLGRELMRRYNKRFMKELDIIRALEKKAPVRLRQFADLFRRALRSGDRMCLCGMLASEFETLPASVKAEVRRFFEDSVSWLSRVLSEGRRQGELSFRGEPSQAARVVFSALEGAMMEARAFGDPKRLDSAGRWLVSCFARG